MSVAVCKTMRLSAVRLPPQYWRPLALSVPPFRVVRLPSVAALALLISVVGVAGVLAFSVSSRTREFGIRMALGADPRGVVAQVLRTGLILTAAGAAIGLPAAWFSSLLVSSLLAGVDPHDPQAYVAVVALLAAAALAAAFVPARRAAAVDPLKALRFE